MARTFFRSALAVAACLVAVASATPEAFGAGPSAECGPYDVIIMLDASDSIENFKKSQNIAKAIAGQFNIGTSDSHDRVTALSFGTTVFKKKQLWQVKTQIAFNRLVDSLAVKEESETNIPFALNYAVAGMMNRQPREATEVIVLISDGHPVVHSFSKKFVKNVCPNIQKRNQLNEAAVEECFYLKAVETVDDHEIQLIYVPLGDDAFVPEAGTDAIAPYLDIPSDLSNKNTIAEGVADLVCDTSVGCQDGVDIIFVIDASNTIDMEEYDQAHDFVLDFASRYTVDNDDGARFGLIEYSTTILQKLSILESDGSLRFSSQAAFETAVRGIDRDMNTAINTNTPLALKTALAMIEETATLDAENSRDDRTTVVIHVGDNNPHVDWSRGRLPEECAGWDREARYPKRAAKVCSQKFAQEIQQYTSATFVSVLVGDEAGAASLYNPVDPPVTLYQVDDYAGLVTIVDEMIEAECSTGPEEITPAPTPEPTAAPTDHPTEAPTPEPTLGPVEVIPGCYEEKQVYRARAADRLETIEDDAGVQTPEQCQATCVENPECNYWSFRADSGNSDGNARAQCNLMAALFRVIDGSARWTSGPRICTQAPTTSPTLSPTEEPTAAPTQSPTAFPSDSPTASPTAFPTSAPSMSPTLGPVDVTEGCYTERSVYGFPLYMKLDEISGDPRVMTPEECHSKCLENPDCEYWNFRADDNSAANNARCQLLSDHGVPNDNKNIRFTRGPRVCTDMPTPSPTGYPTPDPTAAPTDSPTASPTTSPTAFPSESPTPSPTAFPSDSPTVSPTTSPTAFPSESPTASPTAFPSDSPTASPTTSPTAFPSESPTASPTAFPSDSPTASPTTSPTAFPSESPTASPTAFPSDSPTASPTTSPTAFPSESPTASPTAFPSDSPTASPTTSPTAFPSESPTASPTAFPSDSPTASPTTSPTAFPSESPTASPTAFPSDSPTASPTTSPTAFPSESPTASPTAFPSDSPTASPTTSPTAFPSESPTASPTAFPSDSPTASPTTSPTAFPTESPTAFPSASPTTSPTASPTTSPTASPTTSPTASPTTSPSVAPTALPTAFPSDAPTDAPFSPEEITPAPTSDPDWAPVCFIDQLVYTGNPATAGWMTTQSSALDCSDHCRSVEDCDFWSWSTQSGECFLYTGNPMTTSGSSVKFISGARDCEQCYATGKKWVYTGGNAGQESPSGVTSAAQCAQACTTRDDLASDSCQGWSFQATANNCRTFEFITKLEAQGSGNEWTSGVVGCVVE